MTQLRRFSGPDVRLLRPPFRAEPIPCSCMKRNNAVIYNKYRSRPMAQYTTSDLSRKSGDIIAAALRKPVTITQRNKPRLVLLSIEDYRRLTARGDTRKVGTLDTMPDDDFADLRRAVETYAADGDEGGVSRSGARGGTFAFPF